MEHKKPFFNGFLFFHDKTNERHRIYMTDLYRNCVLCPRKCGANRHTSRGFCGEGDKIRICRASLHMWEEPCISGNEGSGTVFFSGCQLKCIYCQNSDIALSHAGLEISEERLTEIFFELAQQGANNINLVTPSHFTPTIVSAIERAKDVGFTLPFVWNSSGYEDPDTIELLRSNIDIFQKAWFISFLPLITENFTGTKEGSNLTFAFSSGRRCRTKVRRMRCQNTPTNPKFVCQNLTRQNSLRKIKTKNI